MNLTVTSGTVSNKNNKSDETGTYVVFNLRIDENSAVFQFRCYDRNDFKLQNFQHITVLGSLERIGKIGYVDVKTLQFVK